MAAAVEDDDFADFFGTQEEPALTAAVGIQEPAVKLPSNGNPREGEVVCSFSSLVWFTLNGKGGGGTTKLVYLGRGGSLGTELRVVGGKGDDRLGCKGVGVGWQES